MQSATESACWLSAVHACAPNTRVRVVYVWAATKWPQWLAPSLKDRHRLLWKLLFGSILSSIKSRGELTRPTQSVKCLELNLKTSATQRIWKTTLPDTTQSWERSSDLLQMPARERSSRRWHSFNRTLREQSGLPNPLQVLLHWI